MSAVLRHLIGDTADQRIEPYELLQARHAIAIAAIPESPPMSSTFLSSGRSVPQDARGSRVADPCTDGPAAGMVSLPLTGAACGSSWLLGHDVEQSQDPCHSSSYWVRPDSRRTELEPEQTHRNRLRPPRSGRLTEVADCSPAA